MPAAWHRHPQQCRLQQRERRTQYADERVHGMQCLASQRVGHVADDCCTCKCTWTCPTHVHVGTNQTLKGSRQPFLPIFLKTLMSPSKILRNHMS